MLESLFALISGGNGLLIGLAAILAAVGGAYIKGRAAANKDDQAKEAVENARQLQNIADAANARNSVKPTDSVRDDPYRRD
jgi:uncharacterized protein (UPF0333 family)